MSGHFPLKSSGPFSQALAGAPPAGHLRVTCGSLWKHALSGHFHHSTTPPYCLSYIAASCSNTIPTLPFEAHNLHAERFLIRRGQSYNGAAIPSTARAFLVFHGHSSYATAIHSTAPSFPTLHKRNDHTQTIVLSSAFAPSPAPPSSTGACARHSF